MDFLKRILSAIGSFFACALGCLLLSLGAVECHGQRMADELPLRLVVDADHYVAIDKLKI